MSHTDKGIKFIEVTDIDCGCRIELCTCGCDNGPMLVRCPMHAAASEMLDLLLQVDDDWGTEMRTDTHIPGSDAVSWLCEFHEKAKDLVTQINPRKMFKVTLRRISTLPNDHHVQAKSAKEAERTAIRVAEATDKDMAAGHCVMYEAIEVEEETDSGD